MDRSPRELAPAGARKVKVETEEPPSLSQRPQEPPDGDVVVIEEVNDGSESESESEEEEGMLLKSGKRKRSYKETIHLKYNTISNIGKAFSSKKKRLYFTPKRYRQVKLEPKPEPLPVPESQLPSQRELEAKHDSRPDPETQGKIQNRSNAVLTFDEKSSDISSPTGDVTDSPSSPGTDVVMTDVVMPDVIMADIVPSSPPPLIPPPRREGEIPTGPSPGQPSPSQIPPSQPSPDHTSAGQPSPNQEQSPILGNVQPTEGKEEQVVVSPQNLLPKPALEAAPEPEPEPNAEPKKVSEQELQPEDPKKEVESLAAKPSPFAASPFAKPAPVAPSSSSSSSRFLSPRSTPSRKIAGIYSADDYHIIPLPRSPRIPLSVPVPAPWSSERSTGKQPKTTSLQQKKRRDSTGRRQLDFSTTVDE